MNRRTQNDKTRHTKETSSRLGSKARRINRTAKNMKAEIDQLENGWEMKCPYKEGDEYWSLCDDGYVYQEYFGFVGDDEERFEAGNAFPTKEAAELEAKRRNLLTRFRSFRDECNRDWKIDLKRSDNKFYISYSDNMLGLCVYSFVSIEGFNLFGCFKNKEDAERAIDLFGDEIKELFVEGDA